MHIAGLFVDIRRNADLCWRKQAERTNRAVEANVDRKCSELL